ncbi:MAG TPA: acyl carrier protein [Ktedonobacteraceae bacterium]|nr:acyl carrier protein [Ktedonobacteraceae bacterium]
MERREVFEQLRTYIVEQVLDGKHLDVDETTPLLEWGVINSIEIMRLLTFIRKQFAIDVPPVLMVADNFVDLNALTDVVMSCQEETSAAALDGAR